MDYTKPQQRKREESEKLRGERDQIKFIDHRFERWQGLGLGESCWGKAMVAYTKPQQGKRRKCMYCYQYYQQCVVIFMMISIRH